MSFLFNLDLNTADLKKQLRDVEREAERVEKKSADILNKTEDKANLTFGQVVGGAQELWGIIDAVVATSGGAISTTFRSLITAGFSTINILQPLLAAESVTPGMQAQAALGFLNLGMAISAIVAAQFKQQVVSQKLMESMQIINGIQGFIGTINYG